MDIAKIEDRIDKSVAGGTEIRMELGGVKFQTMMELMEFAKLMAIADVAIPAHLRGKPGACLGVCTRALRFGFDPFILAEHSMVMKKNTKVGNEWVDVETLAFDSFVIRSIINAHAPIEGRIRYSYEGEGDARVCIASAVPKGENAPVIFRSKPLGERKKDIGRNDKGSLKGSPLWDTKPDVQMAYDAGRDLCRINFPQTLLGWYDKDEMEEHGYVGPDKAKDITPKIGDRLKGNKGRGFDAKHVEKETAASVVVAAPAEGAKAGEATTQAEQSAPEMTGDASPAGSPMEVPDAYAAGAEAKRQGKPMEYPAEIAGDRFEVQRDAFAAGWGSEMVAA